MHDLRKSYNRKYYRNIAWILISAQVKYWWKLLKLKLAVRLVRLAYKIDPYFVRKVMGSVQSNPDEFRF